MRRGSPAWWRVAEEFSVRVRYRLNVVRDPEDFVAWLQTEYLDLKSLAQKYRDEPQHSRPLDNFDNGGVQ